MENKVMKDKKYLEQFTELIKNQNSDLHIRNTINLLRIAALMDKYFDKSYRKTKLRRNQIKILNYLLANGGTMTPSELKDTIIRSGNATSKTLDYLDKHGFTRSSKSKNDRRLRKVALTTKGLTILEKLLPIRSKIFFKATSSLNQEESEAMESMLQKINTDLLKLIGGKSRLRK
jgi:DNA-binding MarR family transcriptional regulator